MSRAHHTTTGLDVMGGTDLSVEVSGLKKYFPVREGVLQRTVSNVRAVDDVSFGIPEGQTLGLVGESGSGKTTLGKSLLRIIEPTAGTVRIDGEDVTAMSKSQLKATRKNMQIVFQDPTSSLNPRKRIKSILTAPLRIHDVGTPAERLERVEELMDVIDLPRDFLYKYPNALSGGQKQRIGIARAIALNPSFVVLDEPTSALDVSVQARIIDLLERLQESRGFTYLFISHDLSVVKEVSDWIGVMYLGRLVELGPVDRVFRDPQHPYTRALLSTMHTLSEADEDMLPDRIELEGEIPDPRERPTGCAFRSRCPEEFDACGAAQPAPYRVGEQHAVRCFLHDEEQAPEGPGW